MAGVLEQMLKSLGYRWLEQRSPVPGPPPTDADLARVQRILVVRLDDRIGNLVLITPLLIALKTRFPGAELACLIARKNHALRPYIPSVDRFITFDRRSFARNPLGVFPLIGKLRRGRFDLVFDAANDATLSFNHLMLTALSGGRFRIGHARDDETANRRAKRHYEVTVRGGSQPRHASDTHLDLLRAIGDVPSPPPPMLAMPTSTATLGANFRNRHAIAPEHPIVLIHPGGRGPKRWEESNFGHIAEVVTERGGAQVVVVWGPDDAEPAARMRERLGDRAIFAGVLPFADLIALLRAAAVFVSGDLGPMHLAAATGTTVVTVFVQSDPAVYRPLGTLDRVFDVRDRDVTVEAVAAAVCERCESTMTERTVRL